MTENKSGNKPILNKKSIKLTTDVQGRVFLAILLAATIGVFYIFSPYLGTMFLAVIVALMFHPLYKLLGRKTKFGPGVRTAIVTVIFLLLIIIPFTILLVVVVGEAGRLLTVLNSQVDTNEIQKSVDAVKKMIEESPYADQIGNALASALDTLSKAAAAIGSAVFQWIINFLKGLVGSIIPLITNVVIFAAVFITLLPNLDSAFSYFNKISPFDKTITDMFVKRTSETTVNMVFASITVSILSGFTIGILFWILGIPYAGLATLFSIILGFIPMLGPSLITVPVSIILILQGNWTPALIILGIHFFFINNIDLLVRPYFSKGDAKINPVILAISVLGGLAMFGVLGIVFGPIIVIIFMTCLEIYTENYSNYSLKELKEVGDVEKPQKK